MPKRTLFKSINKIFQKNYLKTLSADGQKISSVLKNNKKVRVTTIYAAIVLAILIPIIILTLQKGGEASAWWDESFQYRQPVTLTVPSNSSDIANLETHLTINTSALISAGKMQSDCDDMRFTSTTGKVLPYYLASGCNTTTTKVWVMADLVPKSTTTYNLYFYYGQPNVSSASDSETMYKVVGLNGYWNLNENTGTSINDASGNSNTASFAASTSTPTWATGKYGSGVSFDGTNDYFTIPDSTSTSPTSTMTLSMWIKPTSTLTSASSRVDFFYKSTGYYMIFNLTTADGKIAFITSDGSNKEVRTATTSWTGGTWYHLTGTYDGSTLKIYVNGVLENSLSYAGDIDDSVSAAVVGSLSGSNPFNGVIDDIRLYSRAFTATDVSRLYNDNGATLASSKSTIVPTISFGTEQISKGPIAYWKLDESQGTTYYDVMNRTHGTLGAGSSAPQWKTGTDCIRGSCLYFDGSNDYASAPDNAAFNFSSYTVGLWVRAAGLPTSGKVYQLASQWGGGGAGNASWTIDVLDTGKIRIGNHDGTSTCTFTGTNALPTNKWIHVEGVYSGGTSGTNALIYINGTLDGSGTLNCTTQNSSYPIVLGKPHIVGGSTQYFKGGMDEIKVYPYARSAAEVISDYNGVSSNQGSSASTQGISEGGSLSDGLVGYWKMGESANDSCSGGQDICDTSGNGNHGTVTGTTISATEFKYNSYGRDFSGSTGNYASIPDPSAFTGGSEMTVSLWINPDTIDDFDVYLAQGDRTNNNVSFMLNSTTGGDQLRVDLSPDGTGYDNFISNAALSLNTWTHVTVTFNRGVVHIYFNGQLDSRHTVTTTTTLYNSNQPILVGQRATFTTSRLFDGTMNELRLYNRELDPSEVRALYNYTPGPIAHWKADENNGTTIPDFSGNSYTATLGAGNSAPQWTSGKYGNALSFDGVDDYATAGDFYDVNSSDFSISTWVYPTSLTGTKTILSKDTNGVSNYQFRLGTSSGQPFFIVSNSNNTDALYSSDYTLKASAIATDQWTHIMVTRTRVNYKIYINGALADTATSSTTISHSNTTGFLIGAQTGASSGFWQGKIDDVKFYNYLRSPSQILNDLNADHPNVGTPVGSTVLNLKFDEGYGSTTQDWSPHGNDGILGVGTSAPTWTNSGKFGRGLSFDGSNDYVSVADASSLEGMEELTLSLWAKPTQCAGPISADSIVLRKTNVYSLSITPACKLSLYIDNGTGWSTAMVSSDSLTTSTWNHLAVVYTGSTYTFYINGSASGTGTPSKTGVLNTSTEVVGVGNWVGTSAQYNYKGVLDEVKIYPLALTAEQIKLDYNQGELITIGSVSTASDGSTPSNGSDRKYCIPGDTSTCNPPIGEWLLNDGTGGTAYDTSTREKNGTLGVGSSAPNWVAGKYGNGLSFDGINDYVYLGDALANLTSNLGSVSLWFKADNPTIASAAMLFYAHNSADTIEDGFGGGREMHINLTPSKQVQFYIEARLSGIDLNIISSSSYDDNKWHYVSAVWDKAGSGVGSLYVDGILIGTGSMSTVASYTLGGAYLGKMIAGDYRSYEGYLDDVRVYDYARTPAQIAWDYNRGDPIAHYKFDECQGVTINDWAPNSSGGFNGNNGTLTIGGSGTQTSIGTCASSGAWANGASGKHNSSMSFDGTDDYVSLSNVLTHAQGTITAWIKLDSALSTYTIVSSADEATTTRYFHFRVSGNALDIAQNDNGTADILTAGQTLSIDTWYHVALISNGSQYQIFINGAQQTLTSQAGSNTGDWFDNVTGADNLMIGVLKRTSNQYYFDGQIDDVKIYNYPLTRKQVQADMAGGAVSFK